MNNNTIIRFSDLQVAQKNKVILSNVDLHVNKGDFVYLIGKTGSGKSSLLQIIYSDLSFSHGEAEACGYNLKTIKQKEVPFLRRKLGIVFQGSLGHLKLFQ